MWLVSELVSEAKNDLGWHNLHHSPFAPPLAVLWVCLHTINLWTTLVFFLEKEMETHSSILAWGIPRIEEPGRLQSPGSQRVITTPSILWEGFPLSFLQDVLTNWHPLTSPLREGGYSAFSRGMESRKIVLSYLFSLRQLALYCWLGYTCHRKDGKHNIFGTDNGKPIG